MIHAHVTSWFLAIALFFVGYYLQRVGKDKPKKIVHNILRLFYLFVIGTGFYLLWAFYSFYDTAIFKGVLGLWLIFAMEMILVKESKGNKTFAYWVQFLIALVLVFFYGYIVLDY
ncbi:YisL family protein [Bacillus marinisedimentorum]|uniref:YisL family protein n=1 Tax=Bacillus marinisedimentorum TaxID=1821260 RepID=UPI000871C459|nr:YisL family protein [Bacillus marinisedimentorum]